MESCLYTMTKKILPLLNYIPESSEAEIIRSVFLVEIFPLQFLQLFDLLGSCLLLSYGSLIALKNIKLIGIY